MRLAFSEAVLETMKGEPLYSLYVNIARMRDGSWVICWDSKYLGACKLKDAQRLRILWIEELRGKSRYWNKKNVRTIRVI